VSGAPGEPPRQPEPPRTQEEVIASGFAALARFLETARRAAERASRGEGPAADAARSARDALRAVRDAAPRVLGRGDRSSVDGES
jgi:hypothetical protein